MPVSNVSKKLKEYRSWREDLKPYWPEMDKWQQMYEFYKSKAERSETDSQVSLNTPFAIVESQIAKENKATRQITATAKPDGDVGKFDTWIPSVLNDALDDPDVAEIYGPLRKTREMWSRMLKVSGNAAAEIQYCYKTDSTGKVIANNPYVKIRSWKSVIFNPAMYFDNSNRYYVEDYVDMDDLIQNEYNPRRKGSKGTYSNLGELRLKLKEKGLIDDEEVTNISGDHQIARKNKPLLLVTCWEGTKMTVIAVTGSDEGTIIREADDPLKLGGHNLILGMRYKIEGRPYAYGEIAAIYKPVRAQDTIVAQNIEIVNRFLRGSYVLREGTIDKNLLAMVIANGGIVPGDISGLAAIPVNTPPPGAFQTIDTLQQAIERAARFSLQGAGVQINKQQTATETNKVAAGAEPNVEAQLDDVEQMFEQPVARKFLKMIGELMGADEIRYGLLEGETTEFVKATKGIIQGKATLKEMVTAGLLTDQQAQAYMTTMQPVLDPATGQPAIDPTTGQPQMQPVPIPGAEKALVFDVDWIVSVKLDNQSASDKEQKNQKEIGLIQLAQQMGVQLSPERTVLRLAHKQGFDDFQELMLTDTEKQQQASQMMQQQQSQQGQMQQGQQDQLAQQSQQQANQMQMKQTEMEHQARLKAMEIQGKKEIQAMPRPAPIPTPA